MRSTLQRHARALPISGLRWMGVVTCVLLMAAAEPAHAQPAGPHGFVPAPPDELERLLLSEPFEVTSVKGAGGGVTGAKKLELRFPRTGRTLKVKWKPVPSRGDGWNNSPRRELAAYEVQKWYLDPDDYVVPTTVARCIPLEEYAAIDPAAKGNVGEFRCVLGVLSVWLENVTVPDELYEEARFEGDPAYARYMSDFNILTYLIAHKDGRTGNFLTAQDEGDRRVFAIDNGISFGGMVNNWFVRNWNKIRVTRLQAASIDRLREVGPQHLDALRVVAELEVGDDGVLRTVEPTESRSPRDGVHIGDTRVQLGLSRGQVEDLRDRLVVLIADTDRGAIATY